MADTHVSSVVDGMELTSEENIERRQYEGQCGDPSVNHKPNRSGTARKWSLVCEHSRFGNKY